MRLVDANRGDDRGRRISRRLQKVTPCVVELVWFPHAGGLPRKCTLVPADALKYLRALVGKGAQSWAKILVDNRGSEALP
jgi:hypothetical protein